MIKPLILVYYIDHLQPPQTQIATNVELLRMKFSLTERFEELSKAWNNNLIIEEEYAIMRTRLLDYFAPQTGNDFVTRALVT